MTLAFGAMNQEWGQADGLFRFERMWLEPFGSRRRRQPDRASLSGPATCHDRRAGRGDIPAEAVRLPPMRFFMNVCRCPGQTWVSGGVAMRRARP